jgi:hypothetical protein
MGSHGRLDAVEAEIMMLDGLPFNVEGQSVVLRPQRHTPQPIAIQGFEGSAWAVAPGGMLPGEAGPRRHVGVQGQGWGTVCLREGGEPPSWLRSHRLAVT